MTHDYLQGPEPLPLSVCTAEGGEAYELALGHVIDLGWDALAAEAYAKGYIAGIEALKIPFCAHAYALGYAEGIVDWFVSQPPGIDRPELVAGESKQAIIYSRGKMQALGMGLSQESQESYAQTCKQGYADAAECLAASPPIGQAYAYGYAQSLVGHASSRLDSKFFGGQLHGLSTGLCLLKEATSDEEKGSDGK